MRLARFRRKDLSPEFADPRLTTWLCRLNELRGRESERIFETKPSPKGACSPSPCICRVCNPIALNATNYETSIGQSWLPSLLRFVRRPDPSRHSPIGDADWAPCPRQKLWYPSGAGAPLARIRAHDDASSPALHAPCLSLRDVPHAATALASCPMARSGVAVTSSTFGAINL